MLTLALRSLYSKGIFKTKITLNPNIIFNKILVLKIPFEYNERKVNSRQSYIYNAHPTASAS